MDESTFNKLLEQIAITERVCTDLVGVIKASDMLLLENQLIIMEALKGIDLAILRKETY